MSSLRINLSDLTRMQRQFSAMMSGGEPESSRLTETDGFGSNPGDLRMLSAVPPGLPAGAPLVVVLHGCTQTAAGYDAGAGWSELGERHGFAVLAPEQRRGNNANTCFNWFEPEDTARGQGEAASIRQMVARMVSSHHLDPRRVFVTGLSAGGAMTAAMLATYPEVFAGGAIIAGLPFGAASGVQQALAAMRHSRGLTPASLGNLVRAASPSRAAADWPTVAIWHGDADQTVASGNALDSVTQWTDVHGLRLADAVVDEVDGVPHRAWRGLDGRVRVESYTVPGLAHGTPITPRADGDRGIGRSMPYVLDAPISSTWHIARSWGLLAASATQRPAAVQPPRPRPSASALTDPKGIIARALRAAGLADR